MLSLHKKEKARTRRPCLSECVLEVKLALSPPDLLCFADCGFAGLYSGQLLSRPLGVSLDPPAAANLRLLIGPHSPGAVACGDRVHDGHPLTCVRLEECPQLFFDHHLPVVRHRVAVPGGNDLAQSHWG